MKINDKSVAGIFNKYLLPFANYWNDCSENTKPKAKSQWLKTAFFHTHATYLMAMCYAGNVSFFKDTFQSTRGRGNL